MNDTLARLAALSMVAGVAKALFRPVRPIVTSPAASAVGQAAASTAKDIISDGVVSAIKS